jgi:hypothetical protein
MAVPLNHMPLPGSALATPSAPCLGRPGPLEQLDVVVRMRRPVHGDDVAAVVRFAVDHGLRVLDVDHRAVVVHLRGSVLALSRTFGVRLRVYAGPQGPFRGRRGLVQVPVPLAGIIVAVDGLDERPPLPRRAPDRRAGAGAGVDAGARAARPGDPQSPSRSFSPSLPVSAAPRVRAGRAHPEPAGEPGRSALPSVAEGRHGSVAPGGSDGAAPVPGLAVVLRIPVRNGSAPLDDDVDRAREPGRADARPVARAEARTRRRGPLVRAAADQRDRRLMRQLHPAGVDRS